MAKKKAAAKPLKKSAKPKAKAAQATARKAKAATKSEKLAPSRKAPAKSAGRAVKKAPPAPAARAVEPAKPESSLGRPLVTQEEKLYMLFHDDYQARQVFEFLRVVTVKELEEFSPQQIVHMMSKPLRMTVDRIRQRLAQYKRSLKDDEQFAAEFRQQADKK